MLEGEDPFSTPRHDWWHQQGRQQQFQNEPSRCRNSRDAWSGCSARKGASSRVPVGGQTRGGVEPGEPARKLSNIDGGPTVTRRKGLHEVTLQSLDLLWERRGYLSFFRSSFFLTASFKFILPFFNPDCNIVIKKIHLTTESGQNVLSVALIYELA